MVCPKGCQTGWMHTFPFSECYGCENLITDSTSFITGCKAFEKQKIDDLEQCRNCASWINKHCEGECLSTGKHTYSNDFCDEFKKGKPWSERSKEVTVTV